MEAIISVYSLALTGPDKGPVSVHVQRGSATPTSDFNVIGNVMAPSLCSIVNSVTILWGIN